MPLNHAPQMKGQVEICSNSKLFSWADASLKRMVPIQELCSPPNGLVIFAQLDSMNKSPRFHLTSTMKPESLDSRGRHCCNTELQAKILILSRWLCKHMRNESVKVPMAITCSQGCAGLRGLARVKVYSLATSSECPFDLRALLD